MTSINTMVVDKLSWVPASAGMTVLEIDLNQTLLKYETVHANGHCMGVEAIYASDISVVGGAMVLFSGLAPSCTGGVSTSSKTLKLMLQVLLRMRAHGGQDGTAFQEIEYLELACAGAELENIRLPRAFSFSLRMVRSKRIRRSTKSAANAVGGNPPQAHF